MSIEFTELESPVSCALSLPDEFEARCYLYSTADGMTQERIAELLRVDQRTVGRAIKRAELKLDQIKQSKRFDAAEVEAVLLRLTDRSSHTKRFM